MATSTSTMTCPKCNSGDATQNVEHREIFGVAVLGVYETCNTCDYELVVIKVDGKVAYRHQK